MIKVTHDELLARISNFTCCSGVHELALRAVVELHVPKYHSVVTDCGITGWFETCEACKVQYPCKTFELIVEELG